MGAEKGKVPATVQQAQGNMTQMESIPNFAMTDLVEGSPFTKNLAKEILIILINFGLDVNYHNKSGFTPLMEAIKNKLRSLQSFLLSGYNPKLDVNMRSKSTTKMMSTALHIAVE